MSVKQLEILDMIAKGGMAEVYRARTTGPQGFEKEVCVKKILPHLTEDDSFVTMFLDEAKLAAGLNSANIVQVHDLCISGQSEYFIVMEYVDGKDLADIIRAAQLAGRQVPAPLAVHIVREVCQGLSYAHSRTDRSGAPLNIIHRDMSPHNVMVSFLGEVKILDFGIAKASSSMNQTAVGLLKGKYGYMSPEQARGRPLDPRSDIFNTGIVLYELLVGERCFAGSSDFSTLNLMRDATVTPPRAIQPGVPEGLERILLQTLSKDREKRPQTALELERILGEWASSEGQVATKSDLSRFVQELFRDEPKLTEPAGNGGFLEVKSVVAEMPLPPPPAGPKPGTAVDPSLARQPVQDGGSSAPEAEKRPSDGPETASGRSKSPAPAKGKKSVEEPDPVLPKNDAPDEAPTAKPDPAAAKEGEAKKAAPKEAEAKGEPKESAAQTREPGKEAPKAKPGAKKKKVPAGPKEPVGRKHLRPGLAAAGRASAAPPRRTAFTLAAVAVVFGLTGAALGHFRAANASQESRFREIERDDTGGNPTLGLLFIDSHPPGLDIEIEGEDTLRRTPAAIRHPWPSEAVSVVLVREGKKVHEAAVDFSERTVLHTVELEPPGDVSEELPGSTLRVHLKKGTVRIDGRSAQIGEAIPLAPGTSHEVEVRSRKKRRTLFVTLAEDEQQEIFID